MRIICRIFGHKWDLYMWYEHDLRCCTRCKGGYEEVDLDLFGLTQ